MSDSKSISNFEVTTTGSQPSSPPIQVLIPVDGTLSDSTGVLRECIHAVKHVFCKLGLRHEISLITADRKHESIQNFAPDLNEISHGTLSHTLAELANSTSRIVIVDPEIRVTEAQWLWLNESSCSADIVCCYEKRRRDGNWRQRIADSATSITTSVLLRTGKTQNRPGVVVFDASKLKGLLSEGIEFETSGELVSVCQQEGFSIFEAQLQSESFATKPASTAWQEIKQLSSTVRFWWNKIAFPKSDLNELAAKVPVNVPHKVRWVGSAILIAMATAILFSNLNYPLLEPDEARNAQLGLNIVDTGDWMSLSLGNEHYWDKPPLQAWLTAISYQLFGPSEFATRIPCAAISLVTLLAVLSLGSLVFEFRTGMLATLLLLLSSGFLLVGRYVTMDASLTCFSTIMILAIVRGIRGGRHSAWWLMLAGTACGLGLLTKGPVIGVLVLPPVLLAGWLEKNEILIKPRTWIYLGVPAFLISAPWFIAMTIVHPEFPIYFLWKHNVVRFSNAFNHRQPFWFYLPVLFLMMYPACFLIPFFATLMVTLKRAQKRLLGDEFGKLLIYVVWVIGFFSMSQSKLPTYILPALPVLCLLLGRVATLTIWSADSVLPTKNWLTTTPRHMSFSVGVLLTIVVAVLLFVFPSPINKTASIATVVLLSIAVAYFVVRIRSMTGIRRCWLSVAVVGLMFVSLLVTQVLPKVAESRSVHRAVSELAKTSGHENSAIVFTGRPPFGHSFWLKDKKIAHFPHDKDADTMNYLKQNPGAIVVASKSHLKKLKQELVSSIEFVKSDRHRNLYTTRSAQYAGNEPDVDLAPQRVTRLPKPSEPLD